MKIVTLTYKTKRGNERTGRFLKTEKGYIPIIIDKETFLDKSNKIIKEELNLNHFRQEMFF